MVEPKHETLFTLVGFSFASPASLARPRSLVFRLKSRGIVSGNVDFFRMNLPVSSFCRRIVCPSDFCKSGSDTMFKHESRRLGSFVGSREPKLPLVL